VGTKVQIMYVKPTFEIYFCRMNILADIGGTPRANHACKNLSD
jgi:hypothetical protein